ALVVTLRQAAPARRQLVVPGIQGGGVIWPEIMHILDNEMLLRRTTELVQRRQLAIREDVTIDPRVMGMLRAIRADGMQQEQPAIIEMPAHYLHERPIVAAPDMLKHANGYHPVIAPDNITIILHKNFRRQITASRLRQARLFHRHRNACHLGPVMTRSIFNKAAPATANIQHAHAGLELKFLTDQVELVELCLCKC